MHKVTSGENNLLLFYSGVRVWILKGVLNLEVGEQKAQVLGSYWEYQV